MSTNESPPLELVPITFREASAFVSRYHRHHAPPRGTKFCLALSLSGDVVGVAMVGRPVSAHLDDGWTLEVNRLCTDGTKNACSKLYGHSWRVTKSLGYKRLVTYTLPEEGGASLRGAGWRLVGLCGGGSWSRKSRPRVDTHPTQQKLKWEIQTEDHARVDK